MSAWVVASLSMVAELRGVEGTQLAATDNLESFLALAAAPHSYMVAAVEIAAVGGGAPLLHGGVDLNAHALPSPKADELNCMHDSSRELSQTSYEDCKRGVEVPAAIESDGAAEGADDAGDAEVHAEIEGLNDEKSSTANVTARTSAACVIPDGSTEVTKDTATIDVIPTGGPVHVFQRSHGADDDDEEDACEAPEKDSDPGTESSNEVLVESAEVARNDTSHAGFEGSPIETGLNSPREMGVHHIDQAHLKNQSKASVEVRSASQADNTEVLGNATVTSCSFSFTGLNHVAFCVENLERSLDFYCGLLGLKTIKERPDLPYRGAWLFLGAEGIHLMEVPNPDPVNGRPAHGGFDRHACLNCKNVEGVRLALEKAGIAYQPSPVPSLFTRDPDGNGLEFIEVDSRLIEIRPNVFDPSL